ncbi:MAG: DUF1064 domain-containing protein [Patescibacteria group bacterium]
MRWKTRAKAPTEKRRGKKNGLEQAYARRLEQLRAAGEVLWWRFEGLSLRLADGAHYKPDFAVQLADGTIELHETKGHWREAARVRIKVAAEQFPFRLLAVQLVDNHWKFEEF